MSILTTFKDNITKIYLNGFPKRLGVAVSGGVDSMVLLDLLMKVKPQNCEIYAMTIDHKLRAESTQEAYKVKDILKRYKINHNILFITGSINKNQIERDARYHRYNLMRAFCQKSHINDILLAHHRDDQLETMAMRLINNSSFFGLAGMKPKDVIDGDLNSVRPMLSIFKNEIYQYAKHNNLEWVEDPTNQDATLTLRNKLRSCLSANNELKNQLNLIYNSIECFIKNVNNSITEFESRIEWSINMPLGYMKISISREDIDAFHPIVINRCIYELMSKVSCDPKYPYKFRMFDSSNTGLLDGGLSLIEYLNSEDKSSIQMTHCNIEAQKRDSHLELLITRQQENTHNRTKSLIVLHEWIKFDNRYEFKFLNPILKDCFVVNYDYKLHYPLLKNKKINKIAQKFKLPVVVDNQNEILLFPTLSGCEMKNPNQI